MCCVGGVGGEKSTPGPSNKGGGHPVPRHAHKRAPYAPALRASLRHPHPGRPPRRCHSFLPHCQRERASGPSEPRAETDAPSLDFGANSGPRVCGEPAPRRAAVAVLRSVPPKGRNVISGDRPSGTRTGARYGGRQVHKCKPDTRPDAQR